MAERKVESLLNAIENFDEKSSPNQNDNTPSVKKINALDLIGSSNTAIISLGSQDYILRLTRHNKLILTK
ncbi:MAG: hemin uptake protein HemP [Rhodobacterales bacterium]|nr:MAG: hemin uptake protein HemP [Rhodobacterales bacterium]|tara:strand:+ start:379 stop:588 length:210 start_codon:yes stop_codon:yes gene_type:complete